MPKDHKKSLQTQQVVQFPLPTWAVLYLCGLFGLFSFLSADVKSDSGSINFDVDSDSSHEAKLNSTGLGLGISPSANLHVNGNAIVTGTLSVGQSSATSNLSVSGTMSYTPQSVTSNFSSPTSSVVLVDTSSSNVSLTLPFAANVSGRMYTVKKTKAEGALTILPTGSDNIDGKPYQELTTNASNSVYPFQSLMSDGSNWHIVSQSSQGISTVSGANLLWEDNFDDNSIDGTLWSTSVHEETDGVMRLNITSNAEVASATKVFDMDYDATLVVDWGGYTYDTDNTEFHIQFDGDDWDAYLMRRKFGFTDVTFRFANTGNTINSSFTTSDNAGKFMLDYISSTGVCTGYWHDGSSWIEVGNTSGNNLGTGAGIQVHFRNWSNGTSTIDFDNLSAFGEQGP